MKACRAILIIVALLIIAVPTFAKENRSGVGIAYTLGSTDFDIPGDSEIDFTGYTIFWKFGFTNMWGLQISYRDMEDDEDNKLPGEEAEFTQIGAHAVVIWRHGNLVRPLVKFGLVQNDIELRDSTSSLSDDNVDFSIGGGLEVGSERIAFYAEWDFTQTEFLSVDVDVDNLNLGIIFKY